MAIQRSGLLGRFSGKIGGAVGAHWKDKAYSREYVIPTNPNTSAQQTQRSKFQLAVAFAKPLVGQVFQPYQDRFEKSMSGFNRFMANNISVFTQPIDYSGILLVSGPLFPVDFLVCQYSTDTVHATWNEDLLGNNGALTDHVYACVFDIVSGIWYFASAEVTRDDETISVPCVTGLNAANLRCWMWAAQYSILSPELCTMISNSNYSVVQAV